MAYDIDQTNRGRGWCNHSTFATAIAITTLLTSADGSDSEEQEHVLPLGYVLCAREG